ncbi:hypothetical protein PYW07_011232 [Mythimna separata]|uniref:Uncharacterized protein n=1 Tax=Mythimna separata TaxID=271217 RepID=A0AAD8DL21_MYTSE|nr:hypothetical protein PYW07_011232 [Mythimna separata]
MGLSQLVKQATRVPDIAGHTANCLDLLLTTDPDRCVVTVSSPLGTSDDCLVKSVTFFSPPDCDSRGERRIWRYKSADWDEMRHFFASYPWQVCFSSENPSSCAEAISDVVRQAMEYYIPYSDVPVGSSARPWFNADCAEAEKRKHSAFLAWVDARDRKAPDLNSKKRPFNHAAKSYKKALRKARFDRISLIGQKLSAQPSGSRAFWSLAKSIEANFCRPTLPPLVRPDGTLAHTAREKAGLFASLFAHNSRLDTGSSTPPTLLHCGTSMPEVRIRNKEVLRALCRLDRRIQLSKSFNKQISRSRREIKALSMPLRALAPRPVSGLRPTRRASSNLYRLLLFTGFWKELVNLTDFIKIQPNAKQNKHLNKAPRKAELPS